MESLNLSSLGNIDEKLATYERDKVWLEKLITARKNEIAQLENLLQLTNTSIDLQNKLRNVSAESKKPPSENLKTENKASESSSNKECATNKNLVSLTSKLNTPVESKQITKNELTKTKQDRLESANSSGVWSSSGSWKSPQKDAINESKKIRPLMSTGSSVGIRSSSIARINQVLLKCAKRAEPKKVVSSFPNRLGGGDLHEKAPESKLLELHRNERPPPFNIDINAVTEWITLKFTRPNVRLEKQLAERNRRKLQQLSRMPSMSAYLERSDRVQDLKSLMNYDVCRSARREDVTSVKKIKPRKPKKANRIEIEEKEVKSAQNVMESDFFDLYGLDTGDQLTIVNKSDPENLDCQPNVNNDDDDGDADLYKDLNQLPVSFDLLEDGEVDEEPVEKTTKSEIIKPKDENVQMKENVANKNHQKQENEIDSRKSRVSTSKENNNVNHHHHHDHHRGSASHHNHHHHNRHPNHHSRQYSQNSRENDEQKRTGQRERSRSRNRGVGEKNSGGGSRVRSRSRSNSRRNEKYSTSSRNDRDRVDNRNVNKRKRVD